MFWLTKGFPFFVGIFFLLVFIGCQGNIPVTDKKEKVLEKEKTTLKERYTQSSNTYSNNLSFNDNLIFFCFQQCINEIENHGYNFSKVYLEKKSFDTIPNADIDALYIKFAEYISMRFDGNTDPREVYITLKIIQKEYDKEENSRGIGSPTKISYWNTSTTIPQKNKSTGKSDLSKIVRVDNNVFTEIGVSVLDNITNKIINKSVMGCGISSSTFSVFYSN